MVDIATLAVKVTNEGITIANKELEKLGKTADKTGKKTDNLDKKTKKASKNSKAFGESLSKVAQSLAIVQGPLGPVAGRVNTLGSAFKSTTVSVLAFGAAVTSVGLAFFRSAKAFALWERQMFQINALLKTTQGASKQTFESIDRLSKEIGRSTLASTQEVRSAAAQLLTFKSISGKVFEDTLRLSQDLASLGFGSISTASVQLGKALEDPKIGLASLRRVGVSFTESQKELIFVLSESGRSLRAQSLILEAVRNQIGGAGVAAGKGLSGAYDTLGESIKDMLEELGKRGPGQTAKRIFETLNSAVEKLTDLIVFLDEKWNSFTDSISGSIDKILEFSKIIARMSPVPILNIGSRLLGGDSNKGVNEIIDIPPMFIEAEKIQLASKNIVKIFEDTTGKISSLFTSMFEDIFDDGKFNFEKLSSSVKRIFVNMLAKLATLAIAQPIIVPITQGIGSGLGLHPIQISKVTEGAFGPAAGGGLLKPITSAASSALGSVSGFQFGLGGFGGIPTGGFAGATGIPFAGGGAAAGAGAAGAGALPFFGVDPVSLAISAALIAAPLLIGSLTGQSSDISQFTGAIGTGGKLTDVSLGSKNIGTEFAKSLSETATGFFQSFQEQTGIGFEGTRIFGGTHSRFGASIRTDIAAGINEKEFFFDPEDTESVQKAFAELSLELLKMEEITGSLAIALPNITTEGREAAEILEDIEFAAKFDNLFKAAPTFTQMELTIQELNKTFDESIERARRLGLEEAKLIKGRSDQIAQLRKDFDKSILNQIIGLDDPTISQLQNLEEEFKTIRRDAIALGANLAQVEELFGKRRERILTESAEQQISILEQTNSKWVDIANNIRILQNNLLLDPRLGGLTSEGRLREAQRIFGELQARVAGGEEEAFSEIDSTVKSLLEASVDYFGTTSGFFETRAEVNAFLEEASTLAKSQITVQDTSLIELQNQTLILNEILASTSSNLVESQKVSQALILHPGEDPAILERINPLNLLGEDLIRQLKVQSGGVFQGTSFAEQVRAGSASGDLFNQLVSTLGGKTQEFALGGFASPGLALVGESGPELVRFGQSAQVSTAQETIRAFSANDNRAVVSAIMLVAGEVRNSNDQDEAIAIATLDKLEEIAAGQREFDLSERRERAKG